MTIKRYLTLLIAWFYATTIMAQTYQAGTVYLGTKNYVEYDAGNLPIIITAPHGGYTEPTTIPDRNCINCTTIMDANTQELARQIDTALRQEFGCVPHIIINRLHRKKLDANREIVEAANGATEAEVAWREWHEYIQAAKNDVVRRYGRGLLIDLHGHGHTIQRLEVGYLWDDPDLRLSDSVLSTPQYINRLSIKNLVLNNRNNLNAAQLVRGQFALGTLLATNGFPAVPSHQDVAPVVGDLYFNGGYNTQRHGSRDSTTIDGIQIECNFTGVRNTYANRKRFATELATALKVYLGKHYFASTNFGCQTGTAENESSSGISVYPNPAHITLNIHLKDKVQGSFIASLYNLQGQLVLQKTFNKTNDSDLILDLPNPLSIGMYFLRLVNENSFLFKQTKVFIVP